MQQFMVSHSLWYFLIVSATLSTLFLPLEFANMLCNKVAMINDSTALKTIGFTYPFRLEKWRNLSFSSTHNFWNLCFLLFLVWITHKNCMSFQTKWRQGLNTLVLFDFIRMIMNPRPTGIPKILSFLQLRNHKGSSLIVLILQTVIIIL